MLTSSDHFEYGEGDCFYDHGNPYSPYYFEDDIDLGPYLFHVIFSFYL